MVFQLGSVEEAMVQRLLRLKTGSLGHCENIFFVVLREYLGVIVQDIAAIPEPSAWPITEARRSNNQHGRKRNILIWSERSLIYSCGSHDDSRSIALERDTR